MSWFYKNVLRRGLFTMDPEEIHNLTMRMLGWASRHNVVCEMLESYLGAPPLPVQLFGLNFPNPVGLAAGMDKIAEAVPAWEAMGFGFTELGAATRHAQPGNPSPRVFRVIADEAIINRMGFNNPGAEAIAQNLAHWRAQNRWPKHPVGMNLGKSKITPLENAAEDYAHSFRVLRPYLDFFVVNVSSPNTPNLRQLQDKAALDEILAALQEVQAAALAQRAPAGARISQPAPLPPAEDTPGSSNLVQASPGTFEPATTSKPVLVKVAPDLSFEALDEILELVKPRAIAGLVATNTTIARPATDDPQHKKLYSETGGLSGRPLRQRSTEMIRHLYQQTRGSVPIIGVGGIFNADDAWEKITAGASLLQIYTSLVYEGPPVVKNIVRGLSEHLRRSGLNDLRAAVGTAVKS